MTKVSNSYDWEELCELNDEDMENLLKFYDDNKVPTLEELQAMRRDPPPSQKSDVFDGSFGFSVGA